jgi:beta-aspartyl-peptidase (threonine type)
MIAFVVHGGAWDIPDSLIDAHRTGCTVALKLGWDILRLGGTAIDAVEQAIRFLENDDTFDAGRGSHLNAAGQIELDASIMEGRFLRCGAVAAVHNIHNPISLARKVMDNSEHILLVGNGAERFAIEQGMSLCKPDDLIVQRERQKWLDARSRGGPFTTKDAFRNEMSDTVGAVALDRDGNICVGTSTGGTFNKYPGRVGDSPLIGCGSYADNAVGGVSTTGWGEGMIKVVMAKTVIDIMDANGGDPQDAAERGIEIVRRKAEGYGGVIVLSAEGRVGVAFNTPRMARAYVTSTMLEPVTIV